MAGVILELLGTGLTRWLGERSGTIIQMIIIRNKNF